MYKNIIAQIDRRHDFVEYQFQKYYNFRDQARTHSQIEEMALQVVSITEEHSLTDEQPSEADDSKRLGKREDHDLLPQDIQGKFRENFSILQRMRELHLKHRSLSLDDMPCTESERYPFLKELIELDKKLHKNWEECDHYVISSPQATPSNAAKKTTAKKSTKTSKTQK